MLIELKTRATMAKIETKGAELLSLQDVFGMEYMWQRDKKYWGRCSPVLFPIVGGLRSGAVMIAGKQYHMSQHGFARDTEFRVTYQSEDSLMMTMTDSEDTLKMYPYHFNLSISYHLSESGLTIKYSVLNLDTKPMDFCIGAHPGFNVPVGDGCFEDWCLEFENPETEGCPPLDVERGQFNMEKRIDWTNGTNRLMLRHEYFDNDALLFDKPNSHKVKLHSIKTGRGVEVDYESFDYVAFWTPAGPDSPFLCIEPWNGMAPCSDEGNEYSQKRGIRHLEPGEQRDFKLEITPL